MKDELFLRGQQVPMTKEAVRVLALSRLALANAGTLIDVGAGTGSVSLEAALHYPGLRVTAIERKPEALALMAENCRHFGCESITLIPGEAPLPLDSTADAIFIGGSGGQLAPLIDWALAHLNSGGRLVMTFILVENLHQALARLQHSPVSELDCQQIQQSALTRLGSGHYFKPQNPVYLLSCTREAAHD
ncbi:decarboxylating cobalt-precorrin-6B (C(15))-methyltransferase [Shimwellia pseudoproteus]|uniref:decarboxylating cobalt-precorrin-6B (C(15))-methyltransferase n=1 Tax=Shimwellia pseudoproteus TaxID=570012 RepID=UPI0018EBA139|nr:decarboxylating cobalt-precorrin-6B (C(15))-methyltransferase [Shimwellia pseudoproteus]MBJ3814673.1 decarboxylating cobalt-precorrin-6B (C(15))-methyltransferase [Shimwellia pseudoproteus]